MNFRELRGLLFISGIFLVAFAVSMLIPACIELYTKGVDGINFIISACITAFFGGILIIANQDKSIILSRKYTFLLTAMLWFFLCLFGTLPFLASANLKLGIADAIFETVSGITTTGATILTGLDDLSYGVLFWRAQLHWFGGIGIVVMAVAILPFLRVGGMQLFKTESSDRSDKVAPKARQVATRLAILYVALTLICVFAYAAFTDMTFFEAVCHAMSAVSTGGFSTSDASLGAFNEASHWITIVFMFICSLPFFLFITTIQRRDITVIIKDEQVQFFASIIALLVSIVCFYLVIMNIKPNFWDALRHSFFTVLTLVSTTGFNIGDYSAWSPFIFALAFVLTYVGGCTGSTAGGFKIFRIQIGFAFAYSQLRMILQPHGVYPVQYNNKRISDDVMASILLFSVAWILTVVAVTLILSLSGLDLITAFTGASATIANVGPGLGDIIGPVGTYAPLSDFSKWVLSFGMLLGRLEIMTLFVLLLPAFWRD